MSVFQALVPCSGKEEEVASALPCGADNPSCGLRKALLSSLIAFEKCAPKGAGYRATAPQDRKLLSWCT